MEACLEFTRYDPDDAWHQFANVPVKEASTVSAASERLWKNAPGMFMARG